VNLNDPDIQEKLKGYQVEVGRSGDKVMVSIQSKNKSNWNMGKTNDQIKGKTLGGGIPVTLSTSEGSIKVEKR
jgi:hypothetical protein